MRNGKKMTSLLSPFTTSMLSRLIELPDEMEDVSISGLQWFILIPRLNHTGSHRPKDSHSKPNLHREKNIRFERRITNLLQSYDLRGKQSFVSHFSRLLRHTIEKGRGPILYTGHESMNV